MQPSGAVNCSGLQVVKSQKAAEKVIPEPTWSPKLVVKSTNYMDVDPQDFAKVNHDREKRKCNASKKPEELDVRG